MTLEELIESMNTGGFKVICFSGKVISIEEYIEMYQQHVNTK